MIDIACLGRAAVDLYGEQIGCPLEEISSFARYLGGSPANTAVGAARLGLASAMITRVGDEQNGRFVRQTLEREGVDVSQVRTDPERLTALVFLAVRGRDDFPHIFYRDRCADMGLEPADIDAAFIGRCRNLLLSGTHLSADSTRAACLRAIEAAKLAAARVALDIDYRPVLWGGVPHSQGAARQGSSRTATQRVAEVLPLCDLVVGTEEEFCIAGGREEVMAALREVRALTDALLVLKRGAAGCIAFPDAIPAAAGGGLVVPGFPVEVFNVLGAGDGFMAGFLRGWIRNEPIERCCRWANACGAIVVSRHGCAPAMPTWEELQHFLEHGTATPRLREDTALAQVHRATTRRMLTEAPLFVLAFDHRTQLEAMAEAAGLPHERIAAFKCLVAEAFARVSRPHPGAGVIVDGRHGADVLAALTGSGRWIARPVELPGRVPLEFEAGGEAHQAFRHVLARPGAQVKADFAADDTPALRDAQLARMRALAQACAATDRELLLEILPHPNRDPAPLAAAHAMEAIYAAGIVPDWWKLPPSPLEAAWKAVDAVIDRHDPRCRGVLVLGMDATPESLGEGFAASRASARVRGFAVGRSIFNTAAQHWFAGRWNDDSARDDIARRYEEVIAAWCASRAVDNGQPRIERENA
jgi:5-dehydro-2-deoxygluconokinase